MKIDLVMWTYNSARTLEHCLASIARAVPEENICHRIAVDGGSQDETAKILHKYRWAVEKTPKKGIPHQANHALQMVDTDFFASYEHDVILNPNWFERTSRIIRSDDTIGAVQGVRLYSGSKTMRAIEQWQYRAKLIPLWVYSTDNNLYRTEAVKLAGGFSDECMASADGILRRNMFKIGYKWITDYTLVSRHYRRNFLEQFKHQMRAYELARYFWSYNPENSRLKRIISTLGGNPVHVLNMTIQSRMLRVPLAWYILRLEKGLYMNILAHENKSVRAVAMDEWHLSRFRETVRSSARPVDISYVRGTNHVSSDSPHNACIWCGERAVSIYRVPKDWGNIQPKLQPGIGRRFYACSQAHAEKTAEKIFKDAFEYVTAVDRVHNT